MHPTRFLPALVLTALAAMPLVQANPAKAEPLLGVKTKADLDALIAAQTDKAKKDALVKYADTILAAVKQKVHVDYVVAVLTKAEGSFEKVNTTPTELQDAFGGVSVLFDSLKSVNLAQATLGVKEKRQFDPFDMAFYEHLSALVGLESLIVMHTTAQNSFLAPLGKLTSLKSLRFVNQSKLSDEGLAHLKGLSQLEVFSFIGTAMTGKPFEQFKGWTKVRQSSYRGSKMSDAGLIALCEAFPNLETLVLAHGYFTDAAVGKLTSLKKLKGLEIGSPKATPACLKHLTGLPLEYLQLSDKLDASAGIAIVKDMATIKRLTLTNCRATTDEDLGLVAKMKGLTQLELGGFDVTEDRLGVLGAFGHLTTLRLTKPLTAEMKKKVTDRLPKVAVKFQ